MHNHTFCLLFFLFKFISIRGDGSIQNKGTDSDTITCGSAIKLRHMQSPTYYLNSAEFNWGGGSGQQVVTLAKKKDEPSTLWQVREAHGASDGACQAGEPIRCGETITLVHVTTKKKLHTHHILSHLSKQQEVSAFGRPGGNGEDVVGDKSDDWTVVCGDYHWKRRASFRLKHVVTGAYLSASSKRKFDQKNCPHCPIINELEVSGTSIMDETSFFRTDQGVYVFK